MPQCKIALEKPSGWTALYDAVYRGFDEIRKGKNEKKALILVSDGGENRSRYRRGDIIELAKEADVQIYGIGLRGPDTFGYWVVSSLANLSGGRAFFEGDFDRLSRSWTDYIEIIHAELRNQYVLGYIPTRKNHDGKWRKIQVMLDSPKGLPKLSTAVVPYG